jgi:hypothetical protein
MKKFLLNDIKLLVAILIAGQLLFALMSPGFTTPHYEGRIYATTGVKHKSEDLHKLNEAAHYFGQTIIGWLKFPHFMDHLSEAVELPAGADLSAHIQERQNIIFTLSSPEPVEIEALQMIKNYIQSLLDEYNTVSQTEFVLTNMDYETVELKRSYLFGALVTLIVSLVIGLGGILIKRELL